jgi:hypothetical protein
MGSATHPTAKLSVLQNYHPTHPIYILTATKKPVNKKIEKNSGSKGLEERGTLPPAPQGRLADRFPFLPLDPAAGEKLR